MDKPDDQLAFLSRVRGADDIIHIEMVRQLLQGIQLFLCDRIDFLLPFSGYDGQIFKRPLLAGSVISMGRGRCNQMTDAPADNKLRAEHISVRPRAGADSRGDGRATLGLSVMIRV